MRFLPTISLVICLRFDETDIDSMHDLQGLRAEEERVLKNQEEEGDE